MNIIKNKKQKTKKTTIKNNKKNNKTKQKTRSRFLSTKFHSFSIPPNHHHKHRPDLTILIPAGSTVHMRLPSF